MKKVVALGLVLVLALVMTVSAFAANIPSGNCVYCGTALRAASASYTRTELVRVNAASHYVYYIGTGICPNCANYGEMVYSRASQPHSSANCPCS